MSKEIESISSALFDKIRSRFPNVTLGDESAKACTDPAKARFFNFTYGGNDGAEFGTVTISLIDETALKVYFGQNISGEMDREQRKEWYEFLRNLRQFAKRNLLTFDTRDINKSNLQLQDIKQQAKNDDVFTTADVPVTESKLYGTSRNSFADMDKTRLRIHHEGLVSDDKHGARARHIKEIFLETDRGERFLLPFTNLHGARAMARHVNEGGTIFDDRAKHIEEMVAEMSSMRHFVRSTKNRQFEDQETADMTHSAVHHYDQVKRTLRQMRGARGYRSYFESWLPNNQVDDDVDVDSLRERFVKKIYDDRFTEALPIVFKAYKKYKTEAASRLGDELAEWADEVGGIKESTWAKPDSANKITALRELLKSPVLCGIDGVDAQAKIEPIIGDDDLNDDLYDLAQSQGPDADATTLVKQWLVQHMPGLLDSIQVGKNNSRDQQTNWEQPVSPQSAHPNDEYGANIEHPNVSNMTYEETDPLNFIRSLAGIRK